ncbi:hypothetical protein [Ruegeria sp.]|uniref:hypothetical protein n=1 Tax=Ruegeria sp. TaxID=1879320 RepID=UPI003B00C457
MMHAARLSRSPRLQRLHAFLRDGREHSTREIVTGADVCAVNAAVAELRANGAEIACRQGIDPMTMERIFLYRLVRPVPPPAQGAAERAPVLRNPKISKATLEKRTHND